MTHTRIALVIGGGIAGPAAAMALQKAGVDSVLYEAHPTGTDGIGVFLTLGSNGVDALRVLGADAPALARAAAAANPPRNSASRPPWRRALPCEKRVRRRGSRPQSAHWPGLSERQAEPRSLGRQRRNRSDEHQALSGS